MSDIEFKCLSGPMIFKDGYKYQLEKDAVFMLPAILNFYEHESPYIGLHGGVLTIKASYSFDGPSGPTLDPKSGMRPAALHDAGYALIREGILQQEHKPIFDELFYRGLLHDGMGSIRAWCWYQAVKRFGKGATIHNKDILVAP